MKAALLHKSLEISIEEIKKPQINDDNILIRINSCGVCATDVKKFTGKSSAPHFPFILGHEPAGTIEEIGTSVQSDLYIDDRVAIAPVTVCGYCYGCQSGKVAAEGMGMCDNYQVIGYSIDGAFAEYLIVPPENVYKIPSNLSFKDAALIEPVAACANGVLRAVSSPPGKAIVLGAGFMGLTSLALLKILGAQVLITDILGERLNIALEMGADRVVNPIKSDLDAEVSDFTHGRGADSIICAVGNKELTESGFKMLSKAGRMVLLASAAQETMVEFNLNDLHYYHSVITGSVSYTETQYMWAMDLLARSLIDTDQLVTNVGGLENVEKFLEMTRDLEGLKKVILVNEE